MKFCNFNLLLQKFLIVNLHLVFDFCKTTVIHFLENIINKAIPHGQNI